MVHILQSIQITALLLHSKDCENMKFRLIHRLNICLLCKKIRLNVYYYLINFPWLFHSLSVFLVVLLAVD